MFFLSQIDAGFVLCVVAGKLRGNSTCMMIEDRTPCDLALASAILHIVFISVITLAQMKNKGQGI